MNVLYEDTVDVLTSWTATSDDAELARERTLAPLAAAALREATEESGIPGLILDPTPIDIDIHEVRCGAGDGTPATPSTHYDVRFLLRAPLGSEPRVSAESADLAWFTPETLPSPLASGTIQQIAPALARLP